MNKILFYLSMFTFFLSSCSILKSKYCKNLESQNLKLQKTNKALKDANTTLLKRDSAIDPKKIEKAAQYDQLAINCTDAFIVRDSLLKERQAWADRQKKILADSVNAFMVLGELSLKNEALEIKTKSLRYKLDTCLERVAVYRGYLFKEQKPNSVLEVAKEKVPKESKKKSNPQKKVTSENAHLLEWTNHAAAIVHEKNFKAVLSNPYLVSALFYSEEFKKKLRRVGHADNTSRQAIKKILGQLPADFSQDFFKLFPATFSTDSFRIKEQAPLEKLDFGKGKNHPDAVDLFAAPGTVIFSISDGVVVLSEESWSRVDSESTSSLRGGNTIMIYSPQQSRLYRYAHLAKIEVKTGDMVEIGDSLGTVGNSGANATKPGHGGHLHLDINQVAVMATGEVKINYLSREAITKLLEATR